MNESTDPTTELLFAILVAAVTTALGVVAFYIQSGVRARSSRIETQRLAFESIMRTAYAWARERASSPATNAHLELGVLAVSLPSRAFVVTEWLKLKFVELEGTYSNSLPFDSAGLLDELTYIGSTLHSWNVGNIRDKDLAITVVSLEYVDTYIGSGFERFRIAQRFTRSQRLVFLLLCIDRYSRRLIGTSKALRWWEALLIYRVNSFLTPPRVPVIGTLIVQCLPSRYTEWTASLSEKVRTNLFDRGALLKQKILDNIVDESEYHGAVYAYLQTLEYDR